MLLGHSFNSYIWEFFFWVFGEVLWTSRELLGNISETLRSFMGPFWVIIETSLISWEQLGDILEDIPTTCWGHVGDIFGTSLGHLWDILGRYGSICNNTMD